MLSCGCWTSFVCFSTVNIQHSTLNIYHRSSWLLWLLSYASINVFGVMASLVSTMSLDCLSDACIARSCGLHHVCMFWDHLWSAAVCVAVCHRGWLGVWVWLDFWWRLEPGASIPLFLWLRLAELDICRIASHLKHVQAPSSSSAATLHIFVALACILHLKYTFPSFSHLLATKKPKDYSKAAWKYQSSLFWNLRTAPA